MAKTRKSAEPKAFAPCWPEGLKPGTVYRIPCDDKGRNGGSWLQVLVDEQGDAWVSMQDWEDIPHGSPSPFPGIRIRTMAGGGRSTRTRQALLWLADAIRRDRERHSFADAYDTQSATAPRPVEYGYSLDELNYVGRHSSIEEAFHEGLLRCDSVPACVFVGEIRFPDHESQVSADEFIEMVTRGDDYAIDQAIGWPHATPDEKRDLENELRRAYGRWLDRHKKRESFYLAENVKAYTEGPDGKPIPMEGKS